MSEAPQMQQPRTGYIYVIGAPCVQAVKIGRAADVEARLNGLQTGSPFPLSVLWQRRVPNAKATEDALHKRFRDQRVRGEWFDLGPDAARIVREACSAAAPAPYSRRFASDTEGEEAVLTVLREAGGELRAQVIAARTGARYVDVRVVLARLIRQGHVTTAGGHTYALTCKCGTCRPK